MSLETREVEMETGVVNEGRIEVFGRVEYIKVPNATNIILGSLNSLGIPNYSK